MLSECLALTCIQECGKDTGIVKYQLGVQIDITMVTISPHSRNAAEAFPTLLFSSLSSVPLALQKAPRHLKWLTTLIRPPLPSKTMGLETLACSMYIISVIGNYILSTTQVNTVQNFYEKKVKCSRQIMWFLSLKPNPTQPPINSHICGDKLTLSFSHIPHTVTTSKS